jgi:uroporphyrin-III C-methyltransferase
VAVVQHASLPQQRHITTTLAQLRTDLAQAGMGSPSVIVVGHVLRGLAAAGLPAHRFGT